MKWVVKSDFFRTPELADVVIEDGLPCVCVFRDGKAVQKPDAKCKHCGGSGDGAPIDPPHANHFHAGAIFNLGRSANESELRTANPPKDTLATKKLIAQLRYAGRISDANDFDVCARLAAEVAVEKDRVARQKAKEEEASHAEIGRKMLNLLSGAMAAREAAPVK